MCVCIIRIHSFIYIISSSSPAESSAFHNDNNNNNNIGIYRHPRTTVSKTRINRAVELYNMHITRAADKSVMSIYNFIIQA